jgi:hypothetical protein
LVRLDPDRADAIERYLFPEGYIRANLRELADSRQLPAHFIDTEEDAFRLLEDETLAGPTVPYSEAAYEAYFTLQDMLKLADQSIDTLERGLQERVQPTRDLLSRVDDLLTKRIKIWYFEQEWTRYLMEAIQRQGLAVVKETRGVPAVVITTPSPPSAIDTKGGFRSSIVTRSTSKRRRHRMAGQTRLIGGAVDRPASDVEFLARMKSYKPTVAELLTEIWFFWKLDVKLHGPDAPKARFLKTLYERTQNVLLQSHLPVVDPQLLDQAREAVTRIRAGPKNGDTTICLVSDEKLLVELNRVAGLHPELDRLRLDLETMLKQRKETQLGWFSSAAPCRTEPPAMPVSLFLRLEHAIQNLPTTSCVTNQQLQKEMQPFRFWNAYDTWYHQLYQICPSGASAPIVSASAATTTTANVSRPTASAATTTGATPVLLDQLQWRAREAIDRLQAGRDTSVGMWTPCHVKDEETLKEVERWNPDGAYHAILSPLKEQLRNVLNKTRKKGWLGFGAATCELTSDTSFPETEIYPRAKQAMDAKRCDPDLAAEIYRAGRGWKWYDDVVNQMPNFCPTAPP